MNKKYVVTQSNNLIEARHMKPLSAREQKIILTMVSMIQPSDEDFKEYRISIQEFSEMLGLKGHAKYEEIKDVALRLQEKTIFIPDEYGFVTTNWVASQRYKEGEGVIELSFSPYLKPYLLQLKNQFTSYKLSNILSLGSGYSIRLYELMKKWQHLGMWECPVEELKPKLGAVAKSHSAYGNFKSKALLPAIEEVNEKTDLHISFEELKIGRKIDRIKFSIKHSPEKEIKLVEPKKKPEQSKKQAKNKDIHERLNTLADNYNFDQIYFAEMYEGALFIWSDDAEKELGMLIRYVNEEESVKNPLGFIKIKLQEYGELYQEGFPVTFADLKPSQRRTGRAEKVPEWFKNRSEPKETKKEINLNIVEERQKLMMELGNENDK